MTTTSLLGAFQKSLTENLGLKLLAFVISLGSFAYVHSQEGQQERTLPVGVISLPPPAEARVLTTPLPPSLHITLRGPTRTLTTLAQEGVPAVEIDLRDGKRDQVLLSRAMFRLPPGLELLGIDPPHLELKWENVVTRQIPLQASLTGRPADGHVVRAEPNIDPPTIAVKGAESKIETLQYARLVPFDISGLSEGRHSRRLALDTLPPLARYLGTQSVTVTVEVVRRRSEKVFTRRPIEVIGPASASVIPRTVDVTVMGPPEIVRGLRDEQVVPQADLEASGKRTMPHGSAVVPVTVLIGGASAETQPPSVTVKW